VCSTIDSLVKLISEDNQFQILKLASQTINKVSTTNQSINLLSVFNPTHANYIQVVEEHDGNYLKELTEKKLTELIDQLHDQRTLFLIFSQEKQIPVLLLRQNKISIVLFSHTEIEESTAYSYLLHAVYHIPIATTSIHSSMIVVFGQGILITGESGSGKSSLLLALVARNHLWVADDAPHIYSNHLHQIIVSHSKQLPEYIHVKNVGVINVDQSFGKSARIPHHKLAAIIHLSDNTQKQESSDTLLSCHFSQNILGVKIPQWNLKKQSSNLALMVETIAKQLILNLWGDNASKMLSDAHDASINCK